MDLQVCWPQKGWNAASMRHLRRGFRLGFICGKRFGFSLSSLSPFAVGIGLLCLMIVNLVDQLQRGSWERKLSCTMLVFLLGRKTRF